MGEAKHKHGSRGINGSGVKLSPITADGATSYPPARRLAGSVPPVVAEAAGRATEQTRHVFQRPSQDETKAVLITNGRRAATAIPAVAQPPQYRQSHSHRNTGSRAATAIPAVAQPLPYRQSHNHCNAGSRTATTIPAAAQPPQYRQPHSHHNTGSRAATTIPAVAQPPQSHANIACL